LYNTNATSPSKGAATNYLLASGSASAESPNSQPGSSPNGAPAVEEKKYELSEEQILNMGVLDTVHLVVNHL
jgi:hypothetical protein